MFFRLTAIKAPSTDCTNQDHVSIITPGLLPLLICGRLTYTYFRKRSQEGSQGKHGDHYNQHHAQAGKLPEGVRMCVLISSMR